MATNPVILTPNAQATPYEALLETAAINAGYLVEETATGVQANSTADEVAPAVLLATISVGDAGGIDRAYVVGETVNYCAPSKGILVNAKIADAVVITKGDKLASAGDGTLIVATVAGSEIAQAIETITASGESFVQCRIL